MSYDGAEQTIDDFAHTANVTAVQTPNYIRLACSHDDLYSQKAYSMVTPLVLHQGKRVSPEQPF